MRMLVRNRIFFASDVLLIPFASYASFVLRLEDLNIRHFWAEFVLFTTIALVVTLVLFRRMGIYSRYWRYASVEEMLLLGGAVLGASAISGLIALGGSLLAPELFVPRSIPFIFGLLTLLLTASPRLALRFADGRARRAPQRNNREKALIVGAGSAGAMMVRELRHNPQLGVEVVGFIDDDPAKAGVQIHGVRVLGDRRSIAQLVTRHKIGSVIITMPTAPGKTIRDIRAICDGCGVKTKTIPGIYELLDGKVRVSQLRDVQIEDLLRRQPVQINTTAVEELLRGKRVLVTGGGGSIGSELCRQVLRCEPAELIILGHGENSVFTIQNELAPLAGDKTVLTPVIADIRLIERLQWLFEERRPQIVFHAAAHKHVPLMELNPVEAITNNVLGTRNLLLAAQAVNVEHFVMISSDKAVNPTSIMGASKRVAELLVHQTAARTDKPYVAVRFGNVLGSRGSVVLTFKQQIAAGGPVTVTHPEMRRYFMTIPEAVQLVLQAATLGRGGEVFTLDMGEPLRILDLARDMIELSGLQLGRDIDIVFSGMRPGEKLYEELFVSGEKYERTLHEKIFIACNASALVPYALDEAIHMLELATARHDTVLIEQMLRLLVPQLNRPEIEKVPVHVDVIAHQRAVEALLQERAYGS
jgi:FlaA1/EpsC-like NDP-sugar epimerase